jgi:hypothetical protein
VVLWFLVLAFLDGAFEDYATPAELFRKRNLGCTDILIRIKSTKMSMPLFRRLETKGGVKLSSHLPWTTNAINTEGQRVFFEAGFLQRFTFYAIRRGVSNAVADSKFLLLRR